MGCAICGDSPRRRMAATNSIASAASLLGTWPCSRRSRSSSFVSEPARVDNHQPLQGFFQQEKTQGCPERAMWKWFFRLQRGLVISRADRLSGMSGDSNYHHLQ